MRLHTKSTYRRVPGANAASATNNHNSDTSRAAVPRDADGFNRNAAFTRKAAGRRPSIQSQRIVASSPRCCGCWSLKPRSHRTRCGATRPRRLVRVCMLTLYGVAFGVNAFSPRATRRRASQAPGTRLYADFVWRCAAVAFSVNAA